MKYLIIISMITSLIACNSKNTDTPSNTKMPSTKNDNEYIVMLKKEKVLFYNTETGRKFMLKEKEPVFNLATPSPFNLLYYTVIRNGSVFLKKAYFSQTDQQITDIADLEIPIDSVISETYGAKSYLYYDNNSIYTNYHFNWDVYNFDRIKKYDLTTKKLINISLEEMPHLFYNKNHEIRFIKDANGVFTINKNRLGHKVLSYHTGKQKYVISDKLQLDLLCEKDEAYDDSEFEDAYLDMSISDDSSKISYLALTDMGDLGHGPLCISDANGANQRILLEDGMNALDKYLWTKSNSLLFIGENNIFYSTNPKNNKPVQIENDVDYFSIINLDRK